MDALVKIACCSPLLKKSSKSDALIHQQLFDTNSLLFLDINTGNMTTDPPTHKRIIVINMNVGSLGQNEKLTEGNRVVRRNVIDSVAEARAKFSTDHVIICVQECGAYDVELPRPFGLPVATDEHVTFGRFIGGKRGACIYASWPQVKPVDPVDDINEICAVTAPFKNNKGDSSTVLIINVYRNISKDFRRTLDQTVQSIHALIEKAKRNNISQFMICGDFNSVAINIGKDSFEHLHPLWFHQANPNTARKRIDKAFTNMPNSGILEVKRTCENINSSEPLGHKCVVLFIGRAPTESLPAPTEIVALRKVKKNSKVFTPYFKDFNNLTIEGLRGMAQEMTDMILSILGESKITCRPNRSSARATLIKDLMDQENDVLTRLDASEKLYKFVDTLKKGQTFDSESEAERPPIGTIADTLIVKLRELYPGDPLVIQNIVEKRFSTPLNGSFGTMLNLGDISSTMLQTSNSGARDYLGMSLKMTKLIFSYNEKLKNRMRDICVGCISVGYFPEIWTVDQISFLYKNKGKRSDPTKYRPITIAPSLGKHLEKCVSTILGHMDDTNSKNHAYIKSRSCITAVLDVQAKLLEARLNWESQRDRNLGSPKWSRKKIVQFISADDIASAFESVDHPGVTEAVKKSFRYYPGMNLHGFLKYYLSTRRSSAIDRNTGEEIPIPKTYKSKTAPQGSLLSLKLWRIYDSLFSDFYEEGLERLVQGCGHIFQIDHLSYADDHLTIITIEIDDDMNPYAEAKLIKDTLEATREILFTATTKVGCSINPDKSEGIVDPYTLKIIAKFFPELVKKDDEKVKNTFKWLGYVLRLEGCELKFSEAYTKKSLMATMSVIRQLFQFTKHSSIRLKAFKTYVIPIIEMFLIFQAQRGLKARTVLPKVQHKSLSSVLNLSYRNSEDKLLEAMDELSISQKVIRMAKRVSPFLEPSFLKIVDKLRQEEPPSSSETRTRTRSGRAIGGPTELTPIAKLIRGHIIFKIMMLQTQEVPKLPKTVLGKATRYAERARKTAQKHIQERTRVERQTTTVNLNNPSSRGSNRAISNNGVPDNTATPNSGNPNRFYI